MADAMCGPSNPLQQFKQQTDIDRSLQQDRTSSRHNPSQNFRSHNSNAGLLDPEFEAFQAGLEPPGLDHLQPFHSPVAFSGPPQAPSWSSDFQRLQISSPQPFQQQPLQPAQSSANWAQGFQAHLAQNAPRVQTSSSSPLAFQQRARGLGNFGFQSSFPQSSFSPVVHTKGKEPAQVERFDEAAFDRAFDMAREDMMADVEETEQTSNLDELAEKVEAATEAEATQMLNETAQDADRQTLEETIHRIHSSDIEYLPQEVLQQEHVTQQQQEYDDDALAATAQELLEKVENNRSDKFKNSQFLNLMRKLRDREVRVEGDKMVDTAIASSTSISEGTLNDSSTSSQPVYYGKPQPIPLNAPVDSRPSSYSIPLSEQDHDPGRINPNDGQEVVEMLNQPGPITDDMDSEFLMTSPYHQN